MGPAFVPKLIQLCARAQGTSPCQSGDLQNFFLVPVLPWGDSGAAPVCWEQGEWDLALDGLKLISGVKLG